MKLGALIQLALILPAMIATNVLAPPCSAEQAPAWGWEASEGELLKQPQKSKRAETVDGWGATIVAAPLRAAEKDAKDAAAPEMSAAVKAYCQNIEDAALDARFLSEKSELLRLQEELARRTTQLESKRVEYQGWLKRRDEFISKAEGNLLELYSKIKPDAAALQLAALDEEAAAALLLRLNSRNSSAILNQMESGKAARLISVMIGAAKPSEKSAALEKAPVPEAAAAGDSAKMPAAITEQAAEKKL